MIMSVYERTREIGVLKAVGWTDRRILGMILGESIVLTLIAFVIGTIVAVVGVEVLLTLSPSVGGIIKPSFAYDIFLRAFVVAFLCGCYRWFISSIQSFETITNGGTAL